VGAAASPRRAFLHDVVRVLEEHSENAPNRVITVPAPVARPGYNRGHSLRYNHHTSSPVDERMLLGYSVGKGP